MDIVRSGSVIGERVPYDGIRGFTVSSQKIEED